MRRGAILLLALGLAVLLAAVLVLAVTRPWAEDAPTTDCTAYGLAADDPRAQAPAVHLPQEADEEHGTQAGELGSLLNGFEHDGRSSSYHVIDGGVDADRPVGAVIHLHGDGAQEFYAPQGKASCLAAVAASHNALLVVPRTPDCTGECTWWQNLGSNREWLEALVQQLPHELPIERQHITWSGYSGGAEMLSYGILPRSPDLVTAGALMIGGGGAPPTLPRTSASALSDQPLWWATGAEDDGTDPAADFDAREAASEGHELYAARGLERTRLDLLPDHDHFDMPAARLLDELLVAAGGASG